MARKPAVTPEKIKRVASEKLSEQKFQDAVKRRGVTHKKEETFYIEYTPHYAELVRRLGLLGLTYNRMLEVMGLDNAMVVVWRSKYPEFNQAFTEGFDMADARVAQSLFDRANGCKIKNTKVQFSPKLGRFASIEIEENLPPDTTAAMFWLRNRQPALWNRPAEPAQEVGVTIKVEGGLPSLDGDE